MSVRWSAPGELGSHGIRSTPCESASSKALAVRLDPAGDVGVGRSAIRRVVFEAAVLRRIVRRRDDDAVSEAASYDRGCRSGLRAR